MAKLLKGSGYSSIQKVKKSSKAMFEEIKYLKKVLSISNSGKGGINSILWKMKALEE